MLIEIFKFYRLSLIVPVFPRKVGEVDVDGWTIREVVELMRAVRLNGRTGKYYRL
jgi:hypothetical protein